jgi:hypothetical protein
MIMDLTDTVVPAAGPSPAIHDSTRSNAIPVTKICNVCHLSTGPISVDQVCAHSLCWQCIRSMVWSERHTKVPGNTCPVCTERNHHSETQNDGEIDDKDTDDEDDSDDEDNSDDDDDDDDDDDSDDDDMSNDSDTQDHSNRSVALSIKNSRVNLYF